VRCLGALAPSSSQFANLSRLGTEDCSSSGSNTSDDKAKDRPLSHLMVDVGTLRVEAEGAPDYLIPLASHLMLLCNLHAVTVTNQQT